MLVVISDQVDRHVDFALSKPRWQIADREETRFLDDPRVYLERVFDKHLYLVRGCQRRYDLFGEFRSGRPGGRERRAECNPNHGDER